MNPFKYIFFFVSILIGITSCDLINLISNKEENKSNDLITIISNIPDSNWESIIAMSSYDALCLNMSDSESSEILAIIDNDFEVRMILDKKKRPMSLTLEGAEFYTEYRDDSFDFIYIIDGISGIENISTKSLTKATGEEAFDFAVDVTKSEIFDKVVDKADEKIEEAYGKTNLLGNFMKFIDLVNTLRELDEIDNALELVDYLESSNNIVKLIDLIKTKPNHNQEDQITYAIGLVAGDSEVDGTIATLTLDGIIRGERKNKEFNFEYGICYSSSNEIPTYSDGKIGNNKIGLLPNIITITLPEKFKTPSLEKGKYHYRGYFKDNDTGNIIYSNNIGEFEIEEDRWIDLGLPSGILWAAYNLGASYPEDYGGYYAWGETEEKSSYTFVNYKYGIYHYDDSNAHTMISYIDLGGNISSTSYDAVKVNWDNGDEDDSDIDEDNNGARMPTLKEMEELANNCTWETTTRNGHTIARVIGPNGNSICIPFASGKSDGFNGEGEGVDDGILLWSSEEIQDNLGYAYFLGYTGQYVDLYGICPREFGLPIRGVKEKKNDKN